MAKGQRLKLEKVVMGIVVACEKKLQSLCAHLLVGDDVGD